MLVLTVANLKGGTAKTTTAAFIAHAFHDAGLNVLVVDADPQASSLRWSEAADWPMPVVGLPVRTLHTQLAGIAGERDVVVIDTPPLQDERGIVMSALRVATRVVVPVSPSPIEIDRLTAVREAITDAGDIRPDGQPPPASILLTRTVPKAASTDVWRAALVDSGWHVLKAEIRRLERFAQAFGDPIKDASETVYGDAVTELLEGTP